MDMAFETSTVMSGRSSSWTRCHRGRSGQPPTHSDALTPFHPSPDVPISQNFSMSHNHESRRESDSSPPPGKRPRQAIGSTEHGRVLVASTGSGLWSARCRPGGTGPPWTELATVGDPPELSLDKIPAKLRGSHGARTRARGAALGG